MLTESDRIILDSISHDSLPRETFVIVGQETVTKEAFLGIMQEIAGISRATNWVLDYGALCPTRQFEYPFAYLTTPLKAGMRALDAGCSIDPFVPFLSRHGLATIGVDVFSSHDVPWDPETGLNGKYSGRQKIEEYAKFVRETLGLVLHYKIVDMVSTGFAPQSFDRVFCISVLEHIPPYKVRFILDEWRRILKEDGLVVLTIDYAVNGKVLFDIGRMLDESGYLLHGKVNVIAHIPEGDHAKGSLEPVVVAGFVIKPAVPKTPTALSQLYRRSALTRWTIDQGYRWGQRLQRKWRRLCGLDGKK